MNKDNPTLLVEILNQPPVIPPVAIDSQLTSQLNSKVISENGEKVVVQSSLDVSNHYIQPYHRLKSSLNQFLHRLPNNRWWLMPGLRGVGKTTILKQLYHSTALHNGAKFYISFDQVKILDPRFRMIDIISAIEESLQSKLEDYPDPLVLLLDEVQYISDWAIGLKTIFDRCRKVFILSTGSSALALQTNPDVARRVDVIKIYPLSLPDFINLQQAYSGKPPPPLSQDLSHNLRHIIFKSTNIKQLAKDLAKLRPAVNNYWQGLDRSRLLNQYRQHDSLPYVLTAASEIEKTKRINHTLNTIILKDIALSSRLSSRALTLIPKLMEVLAHAEKKGLANIANILEVSLETIRNMINQLEKTTLLEPIRPWGAKSGHLTKPYRYLFACPALRLALVNSAGQLNLDSRLRDRIRGLLWEDAVGLSLRRIMESEQIVVEYDTAPGAADFIISWGSEPAPIIIEVGSRKTSSRQILSTRQVAKCRYGLIITESELKVDEENKVVYLPFSFFFLA